MVASDCPILRAFHSPLTLEFISPSSKSHCDSVALKALEMLNIILPILFVCLLSIQQVEAQANTISVTPFLSCTLTTFGCPGSNGCCTIAGCCGGGCCANGYTCINEGTSTEACCPASDPTKCGTVTVVSSQEQTFHVVFSLWRNQF